MQGLRLPSRQGKRRPGRNGKTPGLKLMQNDEKSELQRELLYSFYSICAQSCQSGFRARAWEKRKYI